MEVEHYSRRLYRTQAWPRFALWCLLLWTIWAIYLPALQLGIIWDDPTWYSHGVGKRVWEMLLPNPNFQFYRPLTIVWTNLFVRADGTVNAPLAHAAQIWLHLLNTALTYRIARLFIKRRAAAFAVAILFATFPFAHQAVAWQAPQQPLAATLQLSAWLLFWHARSRRSYLWVSLTLFTIALLVQESTVALALIPLGLTWYAHKTRGWQPRWFDAASYVGLATIFTLIWLVAPRASGVTELGFRPNVIAWFAQAFIYPLVNPIWQIVPESARTPWTVIIISVLLYLASVAFLHKRGKQQLALFVVFWGLLAIAPSSVGLSDSYVLFSPRLLYYAATPIVLFLVLVLAEISDRYLLIPITVILAIVNLRAIVQSQNTLQHGAQHLGSMVTELDELRVSSAIFVNFPDQYLLRQPPYPIGSWGWPLAPIIEPLGAYVHRYNGETVTTTSVAMPWLDLDARANGPYHIDMRGEAYLDQDVVEFARSRGAVFVSRYADNGDWMLHHAGSVVLEKPEGCSLALFAETICLQALTVEDGAVALQWTRQGHVEPTTSIFVHEGLIGQAPVAQQDGSAWVGVLPLTAWPEDLTIIDRRPLPLMAGKGHVVRVGLYNWSTGERLPVVSADGQPIPNNMLEIPLDLLLEKQ